MTYICHLLILIFSFICEYLSCLKHVQGNAVESGGRYDLAGKTVTAAPEIYNDKCFFVSAADFCAL